MIRSATARQLDAVRRITGISAASPLSSRVVSVRICGGEINASQSVRHSSQKGFEDLDKPVQFTTSKASEWNSQQSFMGTKPIDTPDAEPWSVMLSVAIFMVYFCILREENDLDAEMHKPLWERIPGLERQQLNVVYEYNLQNGIDNTAIIARMVELDAKAAADAAGGQT